MKAAPIAKTRGRSRTPDPKPAPRGGPAPLTLDDILPDHSPTAPEGQDSRQSSKEIKDGITNNLSFYRARGT